MAKGLVLIIENDEWISTLLVKFLSGAGYECQVACDAREGFKVATERLPDCIICDVMLPDIDGFWVARRVRGERSRLATTPFAFLTEVEDPELRLQGLSVGADVFISPPFRHEEVVAQVHALVGMAQRLGDRSGSSQVPSQQEASAFRGDIAHISVPTLLTMLEMERRSGRLTVVPGEGVTAVFEVIEGGLEATSLDGAQCEPLDALRAVVTWREGQFAFQPGRAPVDGRAHHSLGGLLLEAMRLNDESQRS